MAERTTVRLPENLLTCARRKAAAEGRTLTALIEDGLRLVLAEPRTTAKAKRLLPRGSKATVGLVPGLDLDRLSTLEEMDDLDYARRLRQIK